MPALEWRIHRFDRKVMRSCFSSVLRETYDTVEYSNCSPLFSCCDTLPGRKSRSFCLSRVVGTLSNAAWPRLGAHRSGQGKARNQRTHPCICFLGGAMPVAGSMPCAKGRMAHNLRLASWEPGSTLSPGNIPTEVEAFPELFFCAAPLPKAVQPMVSCLRHST